ncbi:TatD family hydrolase [Marinobacter litoralis]|uniref:TatD family hydrolase n=1 Tax=Marinobacter litoralis TaxID=187981 RepID=UPI0018ED8FDD|nr:TatD family hydrolase [Marinobacter litoralis]MBJ6138445.1 TatD family hydrolase [Marinobacter litoralis]
MRLFDAHCHFDFPEFDECRKQVLTRTRAAGVTGLVMPGVRQADWGRLAALSSPDDGLWYCLGIHPWFIGEHDAADLDALEVAVERKAPGCLGVGECGLDALRGSITEQLPWFAAQVQVAARFNMPLVIHSVKAHDQTAALLRSERWQGCALIHGFSGSYQQACRFIELGCYIGVGGVITHDRAKKTQDVIARLPSDVLVLETDAPDMAPAGVAKGRNSPEYLPDIFAQLANLRGESRDWLAEVLLENAGKLYGRAPDVLAPT